MNDARSLAFARSYSPAKPRPAYDWVLAYVQGKVSLYERVTDALDRKAESFMRYVGGIGIALSAVLPILLREEAAFVLAFVPALAALLMAAIRAGQCVLPQAYSALPDIQKAFEYADYFADDAETRFYAAAVPMEYRLKAMIESKSALINAGFYYLWFSLFWLVMSAILWSLLSLGVLPRGLSLSYSVLYLLAGSCLVGLLAVFEKSRRKNPTAA